MPWVKLDDQFTEHPKVVQAGPLAAWLYVCGLAYCARLLTDGFIPEGMVARFLAPAGDSVDRLLKAGLWRRVAGGYEVIRLRRETQIGRESRTYADWRLAVLDRDDHRCQSCGVSESGLHAHHLRPWALFPEHRYDVDNGLTLCQSCHRAAHIEGGP